LLQLGEQYIGKPEPGEILHPHWEGFADQVVALMLDDPGVKSLDSPLGCATGGDTCIVPTAAKSACT
jgi:hypothetical protein